MLPALPTRGILKTRQGNRAGRNRGRLVLSFSDTLRAEAARIDSRLNELSELVERIRDEALALVALRQALDPALQFLAESEPALPTLAPAEANDSLSDASAQAPRRSCARSAARRKAWTPDRDDALYKANCSNGLEAVAAMLNRMPGRAVSTRAVEARLAKLERERKRPKKIDSVPRRTKRPQGKHARFANPIVHHADREGASLVKGHPALREARTLFPSTVFNAADVPRVLIDGANSVKVGRSVTIGPWAGCRVFTLTLEERATCPKSCDLWSACYGNAMHFARRIRPGPDLETRLDKELREKAQEHPHGFAVRLHILGDFYSAGYVKLWAAWMRGIPSLHVFGFTAHPANSELGRMVLAMNGEFEGRWMMRTSVDPKAEIGRMQATTIWRQPEGTMVPEGVVCPAMTGKTAACVTCGMCWHPNAAKKRIVFIGHGKSNKRRPPGRPAEELEAA